MFADTREWDRGTLYTPEMKWFNIPLLLEVPQTGNEAQLSCNFFWVPYCPNKLCMEATELGVAETEEIREMP